MSAIQLKANPLDPTINATSEYKENQIFNFGYIKIQPEKSDGQLHLISEIRDENGIMRPGSNWDIPPQWVKNEHLDNATFTNWKPLFIFNFR